MISLEGVEPLREDLAVGAVLLRRMALPFVGDVLTDLKAVTAQAPFRHMVTPGSHVMSSR